MLAGLNPPSDQDMWLVLVPVRFASINSGLVLAPWLARKGSEVTLGILKAARVHFPVQGHGEHVGKEDHGLKDVND